MIVLKQCKRTLSTHLGFIDFVKAFDCLKHYGNVKVFIQMRVGKKDIAENYTKAIFYILDFK